MPQTLPFFFVNQATFTFLFLFLVIYIFSRFVMPAFLELQITRKYITTLLKRDINIINIFIIINILKLNLLRE